MLPDRIQSKCAGNIEVITASKSPVKLSQTVYSPLFHGVYWEVQDTLLEDIDRIEVIRAPEGTIWAPIRQRRFFDGLTVSDASDFTGLGGMIQFVLEVKKVWFEINLPALGAPR